jgi:hypothetical protein
MKPFVIQSPPILLLSPTYFPQEPIFEKPQTMFLHQCDRLSFIHIKQEARFEILSISIFIF